ncbi:MAG: transketolase [Acidobacteria bacterium]|nr:transketolase [Acidobacteriota bacterium]
MTAVAATERLDELCINTIRTLAMDAVQKANSGHPGTPMGMAPVAHLLYDRFLKFNPADPKWLNRDRFVLSCGHASMLLYGALHINGFDLPLEELMKFRQLHSKCPGHPEYTPDDRLTPGIETTTGPLGQGFANAVGMAIGKRWLAATYNRPGHEIIDYHVVTLAGDGCMMEGVTSEAASLAAHLGLKELVCFYDSNRITIEGKTDLAFTEDVAARFAAYGWNVQRVADANAIDQVARALTSAIAEKERPSLIVVESHIAWGAPTKQDTAAAHGEPLGEDEIRAAKTKYGWDPDKHFFVPPEVLARATAMRKRGAEQQNAWRARFEAYRKEFPAQAKELEMIHRGALPEGWDADIPTFPADEKGMAGRDASGKVENAIAKRVPWLLGGAADLAPSTKTRLTVEGAGDFQKGNPSGRNFHFGVREHAMGSIVNGMALSGLRAFGSGFLIFSDYGRPPLRLASLMELPAMYVFTHDSLGVGEDGPTHQPIEHLASLRAIPHLTVLRPADANEVAECWRVMMEIERYTGERGPVALIVSRQALPVMDRAKFAPADGVRKGAYVLADSPGGSPDVILMATGSEVQWCVAAQQKLAAEGMRSRVVSMPSFEIFEHQAQEYRDSVLPPSCRARVAVEMASSFSWHRYVGLDGRIVARDGFGASAPLKDLLKEFGFTVEKVVAAAKAVAPKGR